MTPCHNKELGLDFMASGIPHVFIITLYLLIATKPGERDTKDWPLSVFIKNRFWLRGGEGMCSSFSDPTLFSPTAFLYSLRCYLEKLI